MTDPPLAIAAPVFSIGGERTPVMARDCVRLEVTEGTDGLRTMRAELLAVGDDATGPQAKMNYLDGRVLDFGAAITVAMGPDGAQHVVFEGTVSGLEAVYADGTPPRVLVYAEDTLMRLRMTRRMRTYRDVTDADIARQIAGLHGLQAEADADGPRFARVQQVNQSDLAFLRERARRIQAEVWCESRKLRFSTRDRRPGTRLRLVKGGDLLSVRLLADLAHQRSQVQVSGYDAAAASVIDERVGNEVVTAEVGAGRTGPELVASALGPSSAVRFREAAQTGEQARAWAKAEMLRRARSFVTVDATTRGSPDMVVGSIVELHDVGSPFEGDGYYVTRFCHTFDHARGLRTRFEAERGTVNAVRWMTTPPDGGAPGYHGVYPAFVTKLVDAPRQGQVEVRFPTLGRDGDAEVRAWATMCSPYADDGHGLEILPEVGSQVLVAFGAGQFEDPYVIGSCWNGRAAPPEPAAAPNNLRTLKSRENSTLTFDDTAGAAKVTLATQSGHTVELDNRAQQVVVRHAAGPVITLTAAGEIKMQCTTVDVTALTMNVHAATANFDGTINCLALIAKAAVSSPLYSTGVGNLL